MRIFGIQKFSVLVHKWFEVNITNIFLVKKMVWNECYNFFKLFYWKSNMLWDLENFDYGTQMVWNNATKTLFD